MNISSLWSRFGESLAVLRGLPQRIEDIQQALGRIELRQLQQSPSSSLQENEFKVFSQWGEDGIIQYLLANVEIPNPVFVEFGVGDYRESNTRFLMRHNNWKGLVIDGSARNMQRLANSSLFWQHDIKADIDFITRDNINSIIRRNDISGDIGLLSVDIDGNDYWVWEAIDCINPRIVICEYNSLFGPNAAVTTPYQPDFQIFRAHYSGLYWGASVAGFDNVARKKGYSLVGSNSAGNNIFFVRNDVLGRLKPLTPSQAHVTSRFRISRDQSGALSMLDAAAGLDLIKNMPLVNVATGSTAPVSQLIV
jgi:hypothetical protein